jgi:ATP-dependent helicase/DNAse subunit B
MSESKSDKICLKLIYGPAGSGKTRLVVERFIEAALKGEGVLLLVPTAAQERKITRQIFSSGLSHIAATASLPGTRIMTFVELAEVILKTTHKQVRPISLLSKIFFLRRIVNELEAEASLEFFSPLVPYPGFIFHLNQFISELKQGEISAEDFARLGKKRASSRQDLELAQMYSRYQAMLHQLNVYDHEGRFWYAHELLSEAHSSPLGDISLILIDGFYDFTPIEMRLVQGMGRWAKQVVLTLTYEEDKERTEVFGPAQEFKNRLKEHFEVEEEALPAPEATSPLGLLERNIFREKEGLSQRANGAIQVIEAPGEFREIEEVARNIKGLVSSGECGLSDIALLVRNLDDYEEIVSAVFSRFGIPFRISRGGKLGSNRLIRFILSLYEIFAEDFSRRSVLGALGSNFASGFVKFQEVAALERISHLAGIIRGRQNWPARLSAYVKRLKAQAELPPEDFVDEATGEDLKEEIEDVKKAKSLIERFFRLLDVLPAQGEISEHTDGLFMFLQALRVSGATLSPLEPDILRQDLLAFEELQCRLQEICTLAEQGGGGGVLREEFVWVLQVLASVSRIPQPGVGFDEVEVMDVHLARSLTFPVVFLAGLLERSFPQRHRQGPFYSDREKERLARLGLHLPLASKRREEEMYLFYLACTRARKRLYLTYPATDIKGKEEVASYYVEEVARLFTAPGGGESLGPRRIPLSRLVPEQPLWASESDLRLALFAQLTREDSRDTPYFYNSFLADYPEILENTLLGLRIENTRESPAPYDAYFGRLASDRVLKDLASRLGPAYIHSATSLSEYARCRFSFFMHRLLHLKAAQEVEEELTPLEQGGIVHEVLRRFYQKVHSRLGKRPLFEIPLADLEGLIEETARDVFARWEAHGLVRNRAFWGLAQEEMLLKFRRFVAAEAQWQSGNTGQREPAYFEVSFGRGERKVYESPASTTRFLVIPDEGSGIRIQGRIDRIDLIKRPPDAGPEHIYFEVIDYKSGSRAGVSKSEIDSGVDLQLPLYLLAAKEVIFKDEGREPLAGWYVCLGSRRPKKPDALWSEHKDKVTQFVKDYVKEMRSGYFPPAPFNRCPDYCECKGICRYSQLWAERKAGKRP